MDNGEAVCFRLLNKTRTLATAEDKLPEGLKESGINKYNGAQGVKQRLIPPFDERTDTSFIESLLHHVHCGLLREILVFSMGPEGAPRPVALGPSLIEGTCGRIKRIVREQGNLKIRDMCIRAKIAAKEKHLRVDREPRIAMEKMVTAFVAGHIETNEERKQRLCALKLEILTERNRVLEKRS